MRQLQGALQGGLDAFILRNGEKKNYTAEVSLFSGIYGFETYPYFITLS